MKLKLWRSHGLGTYIPLIPNRKNCVELAWNMCQPTKGLVDATSYNQVSVETKTNKELDNTSGGVRLAFHKQGPFREMEFYKCVANCCSGYKNPLKFFLRFILEPPYQLSSTACFALSSTWASLVFQQLASLCMIAFFTPLIGCHSRLGPATGWENPSRNCAILDGNQPSL